MLGSWSSGFIHIFHFKTTNISLSSFQFGADDSWDRTHSLPEGWDTPHPVSRREHQGLARPNFYNEASVVAAGRASVGICCHNLHNKHLPSNADWDSLLLLKTHTMKSLHSWLGKVSFKKCSNKTGSVPTLTDFKLGWLTVGLYMMYQLERNI